MSPLTEFHMNLQRHVRAGGCEVLDPIFKHLMQASVS